ncbi:MAG: cinA [Chlamydiia bacterium]|nr:cinA [Chlamydiia bacterium]
MNIELIAIGDEVLYGYTTNSNASFIAQTLLHEGFLVSKHIAVSDDAKAVQEVLKSALERGSFVITTGGLGSTCDDHTRQIVADLFQLSCELDTELFEKLKIDFAHLPPHAKATLQDQATVITGRGVERIPNRLGTASGYSIKDEARFPGSLVLMLPGVPAEMREMVKDSIIPFLKKSAPTTKRLFIHPVHFMRLTESQMDPIVREIERQDPRISCGIYPGYGVVSLHLKALSENELEFLQIIKEPLLSIQNRFAENIYESHSGTIIETLHKYLMEHKITLATAESCTGGALAARFVAQAGASSYFQGGVISYSNEVKIQSLRVNEETLLQKGAVSVEVTSQMAEHVRDDMKTMIGVAVSGVLGPQGGSEKTPVGTICASIARLGYPTHSWVMHLHGNREVLMERTIQNLLVELFIYVKGHI